MIDVPFHGSPTMRTSRRGVLLGLLALLPWHAFAQLGPRSPAETGGTRKEVPPPAAGPEYPMAQLVEDRRSHLAFRLPAGWHLERKDHEVSTFLLDARTAPKRSELREVANIAYNPYPASTFSGALFYVSVARHLAAAACKAETSVKPEKVLNPAIVADVNFARGLDAHGHICTETRDVAYTALIRGSCLRFDLVVNNFCGGEVSGVRDMSDQQLANVFSRLENILNSVRFVSK